MTFEEFFVKVGEQMRSENNSQRLGQAMYNILYESKPRLAFRVIDTEYDPFYFNERIGYFCDFILEHWDD